MTLEIPSWFIGMEYIASLLIVLGRGWRWGRGGKCHFFPLFFSFENLMFSRQVWQISTYQIQNNPTPQWPLSSLASPSHPLCPKFPNSVWSLGDSQPLGFHSTLCRLLSIYLAHCCTHCWNLQSSLMKGLFFNKWIYKLIFSITQLRYCFYFIGCLNSLACNVLWAVLLYHCLS